MAIRTIDGFDLYTGTTTGNFPATLNGWSFASASPAMSAGRFGGQALRKNTANGSNFQKSLGYNVTQFAVGHAIQQFSYDNEVFDNIFMYFQLIGSGNQLYINQKPNGLLTALGEGAALLATSTAPIALNVWQFIEYEVGIANSGGFVRIYLDGALILNASNVDTQDQTGTGIDQLFFGPTDNNAQNFEIDDLYVTDTANRLGDCRVETLRPTADSTPEQWTPSTGTNSTAVLDETLINGDTDYIASSTVGQKTQVAMGNMSASPERIWAVQSSFTARKDDATARAARGYLSSPSGNQDGADRTMLTTYQKFSDIYETDISTSGAEWTKTAVDALEVGVELLPA